MLLANGNGPMINVGEPIITPMATVATQSTVSVTPIPTPEPKGWSNGTMIFWGLAIIIIIVGGWLYRKLWIKK